MAAFHTSSGWIRLPVFLGARDLHAGDYEGAAGEGDWLRAIPASPFPAQAGSTRKVPAGLGCIRGAASWAGSSQAARASRARITGWRS